MLCCSASTGVGRLVWLEYLHILHFPAPPPSIASTAEHCRTLNNSSTSLSIQRYYRSEKDSKVWSPGRDPLTTTVTGSCGTGGRWRPVLWYPLYHTSGGQQPHHSSLARTLTRATLALASLACWTGSAVRILARPVMVCTGEPRKTSSCIQQGLAGESPGGGGGPARVTPTAPSGYQGETTILTQPG